MHYVARKAGRRGLGCLGKILLYMAAAGIGIGIGCGIAFGVHNYFSGGRESQTKVVHVSPSNNALGKLNPQSVGEAYGDSAMSAAASVGNFGDDKNGAYSDYDPETNTLRAGIVHTVDFDPGKVWESQGARISSEGSANVQFNAEFVGTVPYSGFFGRAKEYASSPLIKAIFEQMSEGPGGFTTFPLVGLPENLMEELINYWTGYSTKEVRTSYTIPVSSKSQEGMQDGVSMTLSTSIPVSNLKSFTRVIGPGGVEKTTLEYIEHKDGSIITNDTIVIGSPQNPVGVSLDVAVDPNSIPSCEEMFNHAWEKMREEPYKKVSISPIELADRLNQTYNILGKIGSLREEWNSIQDDFRKAYHKAAFMIACEQSGGPQGQAQEIARAAINGSSTGYGFPPGVDPRVQEDKIANGAAESYAQTMGAALEHVVGYVRRSVDGVELQNPPMVAYFSVPDASTQVLEIIEKNLEQRGYNVNICPGNLLIVGTTVPPACP